MPASGYDVLVIGAGPAGCAAALASARRGQRVLLLEQDPAAASDRAIGEWLHPPAIDVLDDLSVDLTPLVPYATGKGFVICPDDGGAPIALPYRTGRFGFSLEHGLLVETLRAHCARESGIDYVPFARAVRLEHGSVTYEKRAPHGPGAPVLRTVRADRVIGATGADHRPVARGDVVTFAPNEARASHRIASLLLHGIELPLEGFLHLFVGGAGPAIAYRVAPSRVRLLLDVPLSSRIPRHGGLTLFEAYAPALPRAWDDRVREALREPISWTHGSLRPRAALVKNGATWIGDAAGSYHPLASIDLSLALTDAASAATKSGSAYKRTRRRTTRVPETIAVGLHELFADNSPETIALRSATYRVWRGDSRERLRTMGFIAGDGDGKLRFGSSCLRVLAQAGARVWIDGAKNQRLPHAGSVSAHVLRRVGWMVGGSLGWTEALPRNWEERLGLRGAGRYGSAIHASEHQGEVVGLPSSPPAPRIASVEIASARAAQALVAEQAEDGSFEGEVVWCAMLAAQYVLASHAMDRPLSEERQRRLLLHFEKTRLPDGTWGLSDRGEPYLFVTTLVYVAARLLGLAKDDALIARAHDFIRREGGAFHIPSWGKLWLAVVSLYQWEGVSPVVPEIWSAPRWMPLHPSKYYCHTRLIYLGMATLYAERASRAPTPTIRAIRDEIFVEPYEEIDFRRARTSLRGAEIHVPPSAALKLAYRGLAIFDRTRSRKSREGLLAQLRERIRYELRSTSHTCISPVSGLLDILALSFADPHDPDVEKALERFEGWIWEDDEEGARVCGARSATWDTAFAVQAMTAAAQFVEVDPALKKADAFLRTQQIRTPTGREAENDRIDPTGGYCFAGVWHGWPVSDCTAEAMLARLESPLSNASAREMEEAARFVLRTQNSDGGFGSYESRRVDLPIEWLNPSEMFGACMTEKSYIECTASCVAALASFRKRYPDRMRREIDDAIARGIRRLRETQRPDGSWSGTWGVNFIYGTMFGVRGLLAGGVPPVDPQIRRACAWLKERQREDGGYGEHYSSVMLDRYVEHEEGHVVQTAWALMTLLEAQEPDFTAIDRAARFLAEKQEEDGTWPKQDPEGIFFHTALLEYRLYRSYFPLWALGMYQQRARARSSMTGERVAHKREDARPRFLD
jgi:lanosterol synthase